jgi:hypothetical protein
VPPAGKRNPDPPTLEELLDGVDDDELAEFLEQRKAASKGKRSRAGRVTIFEGEHADAVLRSMGIADDDDDDDDDTDGGKGGGNVRRGFFERR